MADNLAIKDGNGAAKTIRTTDLGSDVHASHHVPLSNVFQVESTTNLGASATLTGATRDVGVAAGEPHRFSAFNAYSLSNVAGTIRIECSNDGTTWRRATADQAAGVNTAVILSVPVFARYYRVVYVNGAGAQGSFFCCSSFTAA